MAKFKFHFSPKVVESISAGIPVIALESTVITHGLPYPENIVTAQSLEQLARDNGVVPATILIIEGVVHIGLTELEYDKLSDLSKQVTNQTEKLRKITLRDIPMAIAQRWTGGTTVSATIFLAHKAGLRVFATGGIGGVHRFWQDSLDISADLHALSNYPMIVVTAGCKAILDIPATLEQLETLSVPVYGWQTNYCPAFYTDKSPYPIEQINEVSKIFFAYKNILEYWGPDYAPSMVIMNPIPAEFSIPAEIIEPILEQAIAEANKYGIKGKGVTPWLLQKLSDLTEGKSIKANLALLKNNVLLGCEIAKAVS